MHKLLTILLSQFFLPYIFVSCYLFINLFCYLFVCLFVSMHCTYIQNEIT